MSKTIKITNILATYREFNNVQDIEIEDKPIGTGGFGDVYKCISINGTSLAFPQVIKIFTDPNTASQNYQTTQELQQALQSRISDYQKLVDEFPALRAVPLFSFEGNLGGNNIKGFSAVNLKELGFEEFEEVISNPNVQQQYISLSLEERLLIAYQFVSAFKFLRDFSFVHADLKGESVFVNMRTKECAIIDFDGGAIVTNQRLPNTLGAMHGWLAPEVRNIVHKGGSLSAKNWLNAELWSIMVGTFHLILPFYPLFFLKKETADVLKKYFSKYEWPDVNETENYVNSNNAAFYKKAIIPYLQKNFPSDLLDAFKKTINKGYFNPDKRLSIDEWVDILEGILFVPEILKFTVEEKISIYGAPLTFEWEVKNAKKVEIHTGKIYSSLPLVGKQDFIVEQSKIKLIAKTQQNAVEKELLVKLFPVPKLKTLEVPIPALDSSIKIKIESPRFCPKLPEFNYSPPQFIFSPPSLPVHPLNDMYSIEKRIENIEYSRAVLFKNILKQANKVLEQYSLTERLFVYYKELKQNINRINSRKSYEKIKTNKSKAGKGKKT